MLDITALRGVEGFNKIKNMLAKMKCIKCYQQEEEVATWRYD